MGTKRRPKAGNIIEAPGQHQLEYRAIAAQPENRVRGKGKAGNLKQYDARTQAPDAVDSEAEAEAERRRLRRGARRKAKFERKWLWTVGFWIWLMGVHVMGIAYFTRGFLLTRLVLEEKSHCGTVPTADGADLEILPGGRWPGAGTVEGGCWHPKTFERVVIVLIDALRYDFTVPVGDGAAFHDAFSFMYRTAIARPDHAFLRPFIADPPTSTLQRLKGLTTGTLPTLLDLGSSFSGTAIDEDNILLQLRRAGKKLVHLGDDTWEALFPGYFDANVSRPYDSFNVWDLHTVDEGVMEHMFPLLEKDGRPYWDVLIGHCLGVDHAGHRYGPDHAEMTRKLRQMDGFVERLAASLDDETLLVVMGDHGMDAKGDHGGESDDEVEAALWMYARRPVFGRTEPESAQPPLTAKERPVNQIDIVPTLSLLLGVPIPYNNLGRPIEEAFSRPSSAGKAVAWDNLAAAERTTAAGIRRYQASYFAARGMPPALGSASAAELWEAAEKKAVALHASHGAKTKTSDTMDRSDAARSVFEAFAIYQNETLRVCKRLWARFDVPQMVMGIVMLAAGVLVLLLYVSRDGENDHDSERNSESNNNINNNAAVLQQNENLKPADRQCEEHQNDPGRLKADETPLEKTLAQVGGGILVAGLASSLLLQRLAFQVGVAGSLSNLAASGSIFTSIAFVLAFLFVRSGKRLRSLVPQTIWAWLAAVFTVCPAIGFASNSYTVWEDSVLHFLLASFGAAAALAAFRLPSLADRHLTIYHSVMFVALGWLASYSKLCREEQMPYCRSTYYASEASSTSAPWQLLLPFLVAAILPSVVKSFLTTNASYDGLAPLWIGYVFRASLFIAACYWAIDAADNMNFVERTGTTLPFTLKSLSLVTAQFVLGAAIVIGGSAFVWAPSRNNKSTSVSPTASDRARVSVLGCGNAVGARYVHLLLSVVLASILMSKPMGGGALALMFWQVLLLAEIAERLGLSESREPIGPVVLAMLGMFHFFRTGHQAVLSSIQWDSAFIPLATVRYPWSPAAVAVNTFAGPILATACAPLLNLWKAGPRKRGVLEGAGTRGSLGLLAGYYAVQALSAMMTAGWLRRHLMLYRVFGPRFMAGAAILVVVEVVVVAVGMVGVRLVMGDVFGWVT